MMTVIAIIAGLLPILWSHGTGSELMHLLKKSGVDVWAKD
jgi:Cu/Ag efflux pump CusA